MLQIVSNLSRSLAYGIWLTSSTMRRPLRVVEAVPEPPLRNPHHRRYDKWVGLLIACLLTVYGNIGGSVPGSPLDLLGFSENYKKKATLFTRRDAQSLNDHRTHTLADGIINVTGITRPSRAYDGVAATTKTTPDHEHFPTAVHLSGAASL